MKRLYAVLVCIQLNIYKKDLNPFIFQGYKKRITWGWQIEIRFLIFCMNKISTRKELICNFVLIIIIVKKQQILIWTFLLRLISYF